MPTPKTNRPRTGSATDYVKFSDKMTGTLEEITKMVNEQKETLDSVQEMGIYLAGAMGTLHTVTLKYAGIVNNILDLLLPFLKKVPLVPARLLEMAIQIELVTQKIIDNSEKTTKTITEIDAGLKNGDVSRLRGYSGELKKVTQTLTSILPDINKEDQQ